MSEDKRPRVRPICPDLHINSASEPRGATQKRTRQHAQSTEGTKQSEEMKPQ